MDRKKMDDSRFANLLRYKKSAQQYRIECGIKLRTHIAEAGGAKFSLKKGVLFLMRYIRKFLRLFS
jgi:hypothetical protein